MRCAIYARYSSDRQSHTSADDQTRDCRRRAEREGWRVVAEYRDEEISGADIRRPGMTGLLAAAAAGSFDIVLAEDLDRIARDLEDVARIHKRLSFASVKLVTLAVGEISLMHIGLKGTMDAMELEKLAQKIRRGQRGAIERGRIPGGLAYGYEVVRELGPDGQLVTGKRRIVPGEAAIVRRIMEEFADGRGPVAITRALNAEGIPGPRGGEWRTSTITGNKARGIGILHNPVYVGRPAWNRVSMVRDPETRNRLARANAVDERVQVDIPELRIVPDELWEKVQAARRELASVSLHRRTRPRHLLSGLVRCNVCGSALAVDGKDYLRCSSGRGGGSCTNRRSIRLGALQARVLGGLREQLLSPDAVSLLVREYHEARAAGRAEEERRQRDRHRKLEAADRAVGRFMTAIEDGASFAEIRGALEKKLAERDRLRAEIAEEAAEPVVALHPRLADIYRARVDQLITTVGTGDDDAARQIRDLIDAVYVEPQGDGEFTIEVVGSIEAALGIATGQKTRRGTRRSTVVVAEEGLEPPTRGL